MIQILPRNPKPSTMDRFGQAFANLGQAAGQTIPEMLMGQHQQRQQKKTAERLQQLTGMDLSDLPPEMQSKFGEILLKGNQEKKSDTLKKGVEDERYKIIKNRFGEKEADVYKAAPEGGKTEILKHLYEREERKRELDQNLQDQGINPEDEGEEELPKPSKKFIDFDKGLTPKERVRRQEARYHTNLPLYQTSVEKARALESEKDHLNILEELSPQIGAIERLNINPQSGELFLPGLASEEAQRYVKTLNDFTTNAKDSYGARVTNFDLQQFMRRLPTLANTEKGREQILRQMKIINEINSTREKGIQNTIDQHGGIRNIDYDRAEKMAEKETASRLSDLKKEFTKINSSLNKQYKEKVAERKAITPKGKVAVRNKDGTEGYINADKVKEYLKDEAGELL